MHANAIAQGYETWWTKSLSWQCIIPLYFWTSAWKHENAFSILVGRALRCSFWRNSQKKKNKKKMRRLLSPRQLLRKKDHRSSPACVAAELKTLFPCSFIKFYYMGPPVNDSTTSFWILFPPYVFEPPTHAFPHWSFQILIFECFPHFFWKNPSVMRRLI